MKMLGLGKWKCKVKALFFSGEAILEIYDNDGEYGFRLEVEDFQSPEITVKDTEVDGDTLSATVQVDLLPDKDIIAEMEFDGDTFDGFLKVPLVGKFKLKNCKKIG